MTLDRPYFESVKGHFRWFLLSSINCLPLFLQIRCTTFYTFAIPERVNTTIHIAITSCDCFLTHEVLSLVVPDYLLLFLVVCAYQMSLLAGDG